MNVDPKHVGSFGAPYTPPLYKIVARDSNGKVHQIHECYRDSIIGKILEELNKGFSVTVTRL